MVRFRRGDRRRPGGTGKIHLPDGLRERGTGVYREACEWRITTVRSRGLGDVYKRQDIGRMYCKEVHYELRGRHYFALAFGNTSGGYEVRNAYYKGCLNNKDISLIRHLTEETQENVCVFEGFMDFLSYMTLKLAGDRTVCLAMPCDYLVMNSVNNLKKTLARLQEYSVIHCYLDNDLAGQRTTETIAGMYDGRVSDESCHYAEYKDLNDYLRGKKR